MVQRSEKILGVDSTQSGTRFKSDELVRYRSQIDNLTSFYERQTQNSGWTKERRQAATERVLLFFTTKKSFEFWKLLVVSNGVKGKKFHIDVHMSYGSG